MRGRIKRGGVLLLALGALGCTPKDEQGGHVFQTQQQALERAKAVQAEMEAAAAARLRQAEALD